MAVSVFGKFLFIPFLSALFRGHFYGACFPLLPFTFGYLMRWRWAELNGVDANQQFRRRTCGIFPRRSRVNHAFWDRNTLRLSYIYTVRRLRELHNRIDSISATRLHKHVFLFFIQTALRKEILLVVRVLCACVVCKLHGNALCFVCLFFYHVVGVSSECRPQSHLSLA